MQFYIDTLLLSLLLPLVAGAGFAFLVGWLSGPDSATAERSTKRFVAQVLLSIAPAAVFSLLLWLLGWLKTPPERSHEWLPYLGLIAGAGAWFSNCCSAGRWLIPLEVGVIAAWCLLPSWTFPLYVQERPFWLLFFPQAILFLWLTATYICRRPGDGGMALAWLAWGATAVALLFLSGNARFAQMGTAVMAVLAGGAVFALFSRWAGWWSRFLPVVAVVMAGLLLQGYLFSRSDWEEWSPHDIPRLSFLLVLLAPLASWFGELPGVNRVPPRVRGLLQAFLVAGVATVGVYTALVLPEPMIDEGWE